MTRPERPQFYGVVTYRDPDGRFSFRHPSTWHRFDLDDGRDGVLVSPQETDPTTYFSVWLTKLDTHVVAEDLEVLSEGVDTGLAELPDCEVLERRDDVLSNLVKLERIHTFRDGEHIRKRKVWFLYVDTWQMVVCFQGESPEEYQYWLPMGNYAFALFQLPEALWFATDRDLAGLMPKS